VNHPAPDNRDTAISGKSSGTIQQERSMVVITNANIGTRLLTRVTGVWEKISAKAQSTPLAYKLSFFITVLVVSCMLLLGSIIVQQQTGQLRSQLSEQGHTLVQLMAQSTKEPLLAGDELALDATTSSFSNNGSVLGTAIISLDGSIISKAGVLHKENNLLTHKFISDTISESRTSATWKWQPLTGLRRQTVMSFIEPVTYQNVIAGYAMVSFSESGLEHSTRQAVQAISGATLLIIALSIGMAFILGRRITQPIDKLVEASRAIGNGEYTFRFKEHRTDELGVLMQAFNEMAEGMLEKSQVKNALSRYVSPGVARQILSNLDDVSLSGKRIEGSVLFADIAGFTQLSEQTSPEDLVRMLNRYFTLITCACSINHGIVDKYMGDGVMLVFGAPEADKDHAFHAVSCALLIQKLVASENLKREEQGLSPVKLRIGINTGTMLAGNMGSCDRMEYTVVGDTVNLASRLCGITNGEQIVISREMYMRDDVKNRVLAGEYQSIRLRGISKPVNTYQVEQLTADYQEIIDRQFEEICLSETDNLHEA
jgi:adenylate cyclase